jgi:opacity protein-like surface antigen
MNRVATLAAVAAVSAAALAASPATAQTATSNWYANLGYTHYDTDRGDLGGVTGRLGYHFNQYLGAEGEYTTGVSDDRFGKLHDAWGVYGVVSAPIASSLSVFGRAGYQEINIDGRNGATDSDGQGLGYGAGLQWQATPGLGVRGEYTRLTDADADTWSLAGVINF